MPSKLSKLVHAFMRVPPNRPIRTLSSQMVWLFAALTMLGLDLGYSFVVAEGLVIGKIYSLGVILNKGKLVSRDTAPFAYWSLMGFYSIGAVSYTHLTLPTNREV